MPPVSRMGDNTLGGIQATITAMWARNDEQTDFVLPDRNPAGSITAMGQVTGVVGATTLKEYTHSEADVIGSADGSGMVETFEYVSSDPAPAPGEVKLVPPDDSLVTPLVITSEVPDETPATIEVYDAVTDQLVPGGRMGSLVVRGGKVVNASTGDPPRVSFRFANKPYESWDKPYFYFKATVDYQDLKIETPKDYTAQPGDCLRVRYWHMCMSETKTSIGESCRRECRGVRDTLNGVENSAADYQDFNTDAFNLPVWGSVIRNVYTLFSSSHGSIRKLSDNSVPDCPDDRPPELPTSEYCSLMCYCVWGSGPGMGPWIGARELNLADKVISVPRYLLYSSSCLTGWEPSLAEAIIAKGCRNVLCFRKVVFCDDCEALTKKFFDKWATIHKLDPSKIPDVFFEVASDYYRTMRPVLYGAGGGAITGSDGLSPWAIVGIVAAVVAVVAVGVLVGAAVLGLL